MFRGPWSSGGNVINSQQKIVKVDCRMASCLFMKRVWSTVWLGTRALAGKLGRFRAKHFKSSRRFVPGRDMKPVHLNDSSTQLTNVFESFSVYSVPHRTAGYEGVIGPNRADFASRYPLLPKVNRGSTFPWRHPHSRLWSLCAALFSAGTPLCPYGLPTVGS